MYGRSTQQFAKKGKRPLLQQVKLLAARRAYEFSPDDLRLTVFTLKPVQDAIQQSLHFQLATVGSPLPTFGEVPATLPPGVVFNWGLWPSEDEVLIPIRFLHIEQRRIVIDVAGPSSTLAPIFEHVRRIVAEIPVAHDSPVIGEPERIRDYSEISAKFSWSLDAIFAPKVRKLLAHAAGIPSNQREMLAAPSLYMRPQSVQEEAQGAVTIADSQVLQLAARKGTLPDEHMYFSGAPLDSDAHLAYLKELDAILAP